MKKIFAALLVVCMIVSLAACGTTAPAATEATEAPAEEAAATEEVPAEEAAEATEATYTLGMGVSVSTDSTTAAEGETPAHAQVDATVATVVTDENGVIVAARLDCAQNKMDVEDGVVDAAKEFLSKVELKEDYNMVKYSNATLEWYEQAQGFEAYVVGKTAEEVKNMELVTNEEGHQVTTDEALYATCSISIEGFIDAVVKACEDDGASTFTSNGEFTLGLACISTADESQSASETEDGNAMVKMYTEFGAVALDGEGKILAAVTDAIQPKISVSADGATVEANFVGTKRELKDDYNMVKYSNATYEWYQQAKAFEEYVVGMTAADVLGMETSVNEEGHNVTTDETLFATCSISIDGMQNVLARACEYAR